MAKKNEILLSIALEGDDDVKRRMQSAGESGQKSLGNIEKDVGKAGEALGKLKEPLGGLREALGPLLDEAGLGGLAGLLGGGGLLARLAGVAGPAAAVGALAGLALHLAKVSEETKKTKASLKAFGDGDDGFDRLTERAKKLGTSADNLVPGRERALSYNREIAASNPSVIHPPNYQEPDDANQVRIVGGRRDNSPVNLNAHDKATDALINETKVDNKQGIAAAIAAVNKFQDSIFANKALTADAVKELAGFSKTAANFVGSSLSQKLGQDVGTSEKLIGYINRNGPISPRTVDDELAKNSGKAESDAAAARGVSDAFDRLKSNTGRLDEAFGKVVGGPLNKLLTDRLDKVSGGVGKAAELIDHNADKIQQGAKTGFEIGSKIPIPGAGLLGGAVGGAVGAEVGIGGDLLREAKEPVSKFFESGIPEFLKKALLDPGALQGKERPEQKTPAVGFDRTFDGWLIKPPDEQSPLPPPQQQSPPSPPTQPVDTPTKAASDNKKSDEAAHGGGEHASGPLSFSQLRALRERTGEIPDIADLPKGGFDTVIDHIIKAAKSGFTAPGEALASKEPVTTEHMLAPARDIASIAVGGPTSSAIMKEVVKSFATIATETIGPHAREAIVGTAEAAEGHAPEQGHTPEQGHAPEPSFADRWQSVIESLAAKGEPQQQPQQQAQQPFQQQADASQNPAAPNVAALDGAAGAAAEGLKQVASAAPAAANKLSNSGGDNAGTQTVSAKDGGFIRRFDGGGPVSGPGTSTSDDIPARLSDGEFVVNARETGRNRSVLHSINDGSFAKRIAGMFADGGIARFDEGGAVNPSANSSDLPHGPYDVTATEDGGAIINGVKYPPGAPILQNPIIQQALKASRQEQQSQKRKYKSDFVGRFGHDDDTDSYVAGGGLIGHDGVRHYDSGGSVSGPGTSSSDDIPAYLSHGEYVVNARETGRNLSTLKAINSGKFSQHLSKMFASGGRIEIPRFADGGRMGGLSMSAPSAAPSVGNITAPGGDFAGYHAIDMRTDFGNHRVIAPEHVARGMASAARDSANAQTGPRPSWYKGR